MSKPWAKVGAWAAEAEQAEEEEREQAEKAAAAAAAASAAAGGGDSKSFPSLRDAVSTKPKKKKMSLQEFTMQRPEPAFDYKGLTPDEMLRLPTGPKERSAEEMQSGRLGGGFSSYGRSGGGPGRMRDRDGDGDNTWGSNRRSYGGGFDDDRRGPPSRVSDFDQPSRADEVDNWASGKKSLPSFDSGRSNRYGSLGGGGVEVRGMSRADEVDNWASVKKPMPARSSTFGSGFRNSGPEPNRWTRGGLREEDGERERRRLVLDPPRGEGAIVEPVVRTNKSNPFGLARPREEILAEKGLDWKKLDLAIEAKKTSRPTSSQSSRPSSVQSSRSEGPALQGIEQSVKPRPKVNPFGDAKPREVLLQQKGMDWRKIDLELEHRSVDRPETQAEKNLREEIHHLKMELKKESKTESLQGSGEEQTSVHDVILRKERELELLIHELDDKVRFGPKATERPGSGAGRVAAFPERPPSQSGRYEESRSREFMGRPRSRGTGDAWTMHGNDRMSFQGGRERGFLGNRDIDRSRSRERW
ncbi:eukaryotic translation initiation factor 4B2-like [Cornus florida]|uniref:eukaryotic translation initiation factor 4B2-like n=1 Tax=Cornus florida TaxID=4283 RepID=UPI00289E6BB3|nr:eukaryotic translation initiation factor 4B2-like [Cornus florida]